MAESKTKKDADTVHRIVFYKDARDVIKTAEDALGPTLRAGGATLSVVEREFVRPLRRMARQNGWSDRCVVLPARRTLKRLWAKAADDAQMNAEALALVDTVRATGNGGFAVLSQMGPYLFARTRLDDAYALERFWNALCGQHQFPLTCLYPMEAADDEELERFMDMHER